MNKRGLPSGLFKAIEGILTEILFVFVVLAVGLIISYIVMQVF